MQEVWPFRACSVRYDLIAYLELCAQANSINRSHVPHRIVSVGGPNTTILWTAGMIGRPWSNFSRLVEFKQ